MEPIYILAVVILVGFIVTYHVFYIKDVFKVFLLVVLVGIGAYTQWYKMKADKVDEADTKVFFDKLEKSIDVELVLHNLYSIHTFNGKLKYVRRHKRIVKFIQDIKVIEIYDVPTFQRVIVLMENFLKIHFYIMIEKYQPSLNIPVLHDIHLEILNVLSQCIFIMPKVSKVLDIPDIDTYMERRIKDIDAILQNFEQMVTNKFCAKGKCDHLTYNSPKPNDVYDPHNLFV